MKIKAVSLSILFTILNFGLYGQSALKVPALKPYDISIYLNGQVFGSPHNGLQEARQLAPSSQILARDYSDFNSQGYARLGNGGADFMLGLQLRNKEKNGYRNAFLRVGLGYAAGNSFAVHLSKVEQKPYDTLISNQTGDQIFIDSITTKNLEVNYYSSYLKLDVAHLWRTNDHGHWSFYGGVGVRATMGFNSYADVMYYESKGTMQEGKSVYDYYHYGDKYNNDVQENETYNGGTSFWGAFYLPLGVDVRFGDVNYFWKRIHVFAELRPGIDFGKIPKLDFAPYPFMQGGLGLRVTI